MKYNTRTMLKMGKVERYTRAPITEISMWATRLLLERIETKISEITLIVDWAGSIKVFRLAVITEVDLLGWVLAAEFVYADE